MFLSVSGENVGCVNTLVMSSSVLGTADELNVNGDSKIVLKSDTIRQSLDGSPLYTQLLIVTNQHHWSSRLQRMPG